MRHIQYKVRGPVGTDLHKRWYEDDQEPGVPDTGDWTPCTDKEVAEYQKEHGSLLPKPAKK